LLYVIYMAVAGLPPGVADIPASRARRPGTQGLICAAFLEYNIGLLESGF
jgi:hypothetical protein